MDALAPSLLIAAAAALAPAIPLPYVSGRCMAHARALWLLGLLTVGIVWIAQTELWLALLGLWFLIRWPRTTPPRRLVPSFVLWLGVGASWLLLRRIPADAWPWISGAWVALALWHTLTVVLRRLRWGGRQKADMGSPVITAMYLALMLPLAPWWAWPPLLAGLALISSVSALIALAVGLVWLWPSAFVLVAAAAGGLSGLILWAWSPVIAGQRILEWTPRGDTIDAIVSRARGWQLLIHHGRQHWLLGVGPMMTEPSLLRWGSRYNLELCWGEGFNDPLQLWYEYGVVGLLAAVTFVWPIVQHLNMGDPWAAAWLIGGVLSLGHWPCRHVSIGLVWLAIGAKLVQ